MDIYNILEKLKINEDIEIAICNKSLNFSGRIGRNRNGYWFELKELSGWGEDWEENNLSFVEAYGLLELYSLLEWRWD